MRVFAAAATVAAFFVSGVAQASPTPSHSYEFSDSLADDLGGPSMALNPGAPSGYGGAGVGRGFEFGINNGPNVAGAFASSEVYSIEMFFSLDSIVAGQYRRLVDFKNGSTDQGLYYLGDSLVFYNTRLPTDVNVVQDQMVHLVLTRDADANFTAYFNGQAALALQNTGNLATLTGPNRIVRFFDDDGGEASSGFVDFIRTYDVALGQSDVDELYNQGVPVRFDAVGAVPEPGAWALMILGFGGAGAALRARRRTALA